MDIIKEFNKIEERSKKAIQEQPTLEAERNIVKREIASKIKELKELGVEFENKEDLTRVYKETEDNLKLSLESLKRKLDEYDYLKQELDVIENNENMGGIY